MSVFGADGNVADATRGAWKSALEIWSALDALDSELASELTAPLRVGMGLHAGVAVVGLIGPDEERSLQFLGDTGNLAAKLEEHTKQLGCVLVASAEAVARLVRPMPALETAIVPVAGRQISVAFFREQSELQKFLAIA